MRYSPRKQCYFALFFFAFVALCVGVIELLHQNQQDLQQERVQVEAKEQLSILRSNLEAPINKEYWGVISAVVDFDGLMRETGVFDFSYHYPLTIRGYDSGGEYGDMFFGDPNQTGKLYAKEHVHFPYGGWSMAAYAGGQLEQQISWFELNIVRIIGYPILIALSIALIVIYRLYIIADDRALHDELTHLPNRRYFMQSYKQQFEIAKRYKKRYSFALINIDLDRFKHIKAPSLQLGNRKQSGSSHQRADPFCARCLPVRRYLGLWLHML